MSEIVSTASTSVSLTEKIKYAEHLAQSGLLPKSYQRQPANVLLAMEYGDALGIHQMTAINEINVISGKPAMSASLMQSLARAAGHKVRVSGDAERAVCTIIRKDDPDYEHVSEWTKAKAESAGLWGRGHWAKDPALMLKWRAISECVRLACSEVLGGLKYTPEEVTEFASSGWKSDRPAPQPQRSARPVPAQEQPQEGDSIADRIDSCLASDNAQQVYAFGKWLANSEPDHPRLAEVRAHYEALAAQDTTNETAEATQTALEGDIVDEDQS